MQDESTAHYREIIEEAARLLSGSFNLPVHFSKVIQISEPDRRNLILRLEINKPTTEMPLTVILKKNATEKQMFDRGDSETKVEQLSRFAHDWAGVEFLTQIGNHHGPIFYAGSLEHKFIILEDLGLAHPSLVGPLTRESTPQNIQEAKAALRAYVRRLGKMHADTAGKYDQFTSILKRIYPEALRFNYLPDKDGEIALNQFKKIIGYESKELTEEILDVLEFSQLKNEFTVFLHGDICPDNVYYQDNEMRFLDFEFGDFGCALFDGVYLRMCMPSCWCSKAVPPAIVKEMEAIYREELKAKIFSASDDAVYNMQLAYASAYWLVRTIKQIADMDLIDHEWVCPSGPVDADSKWEPEKNAFRPRVISRLGSFISCSKETNYLPSLCEAAVQLQAHLIKLWPEIQEIDVFPVFKS